MRGIQHWAHLLKRVCGSDLESCRHCGGELKIIAAIEQRYTIATILTPLSLQAHPPSRAPMRGALEHEADLYPNPAILHSSVYLKREAGVRR